MSRSRRRKTATGSPFDRPLKGLLNPISVRSGPSKRPIVQPRTRATCFDGRFNESDSNFIPRLPLWHRRSYLDPGWRDFVSILPRFELDQFFSALTDIAEDEFLEFTRKDFLKIFHDLLGFSKVSPSFSQFHEIFLNFSQRFSPFSRGFIRR